MRIISIAIAVTFSLLLGLAPPRAGAIDLMEVYGKAVTADPVFMAAGYDHQASREILTQANSAYLPSLVASYDWTRTKQAILESENALFQTGSSKFNTTVVALTLTQPLFRYANVVRMRQARAELKQADAELEKARQDLMLRSAENYLKALGAEDQLQYLEAERTAVENQLRLAKAKEKAQLGPVSDLLEADARLASVMADYSEAEVTQRDSYEAIAELTGESPNRLAKLQTEFPLVVPDPLEPAHWVEAALKQNWELEVQRHVLEVSRREVKRQNAGHFPTLDLELRDTIKDSGGTVFGGGSEVENREVMLSFNLPLYLGGSVSSKKREAAFRYQSEHQEMMRISRKVRRETERGFSSIVNAIERVRAREKEVAAQSEVLKLKRVGYEASLYTNLSVLDAERDLFFAQRDLASARYEYLLNSLRLRAIVGVLSEDDLVNLNQWLTQ